MKTLLPEVLELAELHAAKHPDMLVELHSVREKCLIWASPSHKALLGYDPAELVGLNWKAFVDPADHAHKEIMVEDALLTGGSMQIGFHYLTKSGKRLYVKVIDTLYDDPESEEQYVLCRTTHIGPV